MLANPVSQSLLRPSQNAVNGEDDPVTGNLDTDNLRSGAFDLHNDSLSLRISPKIKLAIGKIRGWDLERLDVTRYE